MQLLMSDAFKLSDDVLMTTLTRRSAHPTDTQAEDTRVAAHPYTMKGVS